MGVESFVPQIITILLIYGVAFGVVIAIAIVVCRVILWAASTAIRRGIDESSLGRRDPPAPPIQKSRLR